MAVKLTIEQKLELKAAKANAMQTNKAQRLAHAELKKAQKKDNKAAKEFMVAVRAYNELKQKYTASAPAKA